MSVARRKHVARFAAALAAVAGIAPLAGCGIEDPYASSSTSDDRGAGERYAGSPTLDRREATADARTLATPAPRETAATPKGAAKGAALAAGNWTTATVREAFRAAAGLSMGEARTTFRRQGKQMQLGAREASVEVRSRTAVAAVVVRGSGNARRAIVVTREAVTGGDLSGEGAQYELTLAELERVGEGWAVSRWLPQS